MIGQANFRRYLRCCEYKKNELMDGTTVMDLVKRILNGPLIPLSESVPSFYF